MRKTKSTTSEVWQAWFLSFATMACGIAFTETGGRGWVFGAIVGLMLLIGVIGGIAER